MQDQAGTYFFTQGVLGVIVVVMACTFAYYYRKTQKQIDDKDKVIFDLQEARRMDYKETLKEFTDVVQTNSTSMRILSEKIEVGKRIERSQ